MCVITAYLQFNCGFKNPSFVSRHNDPSRQLRVYRSRVKGRPAGSREARRIYFSFINSFSFRLSSIYTPANRPRDLVEMISVIRVSLSDEAPREIVLP